ncbi:MAG: hypothetical protein FE78DRAFT_69836 [Acidomyces sp. 'richmondensis']|nr:MAG: hypothetical protein FE78DRAFT_69836 [Acidomyces sp. 'richmondensis']
MPLKLKGSSKVTRSARMRAFMKSGSCRSDIPGGRQKNHICDLEPKETIPAWLLCVSIYLLLTFWLLKIRRAFTIERVVQKPQKDGLIWFGNVPVRWQGVWRRSTREKKIASSPDFVSLTVGRPRCRNLFDTVTYDYEGAENSTWMDRGKMRQVCDLTASDKKMEVLQQMNPATQSEVFQSMMVPNFSHQHLKNDEISQKRSV